MSVAPPLVWFVVSCSGIQISLCQNSVDVGSHQHEITMVPTHEQIFQFSLYPRVSTNGYHSDHYYNKYSLNLLGGISAGNRAVEVGIGSNANIQGTTGLQLAGIVNLTGIHAFRDRSTSEQRTLINRGYRTNMKGVQAAGLLNYVRNNSSGVQLAGALNIAGDDSRGFQFGGLGNFTGGDTEGVQVGTLFNISLKTVSGVQLSALANYTEGQLSGAQIALVNKAGRIKGKKSTPPTSARGMQLGLVNFATGMDGWQIGLVNFSKGFRGKQVGLINFFPKHGSKEVIRMGTPVGLLNFGSKGSYLRIHYNEIYTTNIEYTTGNCLNCTWTQSGMPLNDNNLIYNQNSLILGIDPQNSTWGFGYGFQKVLYNKSSILITDKNNRKRLIVYGLKFMHLNRDRNFDHSFNFLNRLNFDYALRKFSGYVYVGVSLNYFMFEGGESGGDIYKIRSIRIPAGNPFGLHADFWPGYAIGFQF
jgi:hypothetical protein